MATIMKVVYEEDELADILTTALEGGIGYWSVADKIERDKDLRIRSVNLEGTEETAEDFHPRNVKPWMLQHAIDKIVSGKEPLRKDIVESIRSGDVGNIDTDGADCIVQVALFGKVVYG